jgi:hypothetical protein
MNDYHRSESLPWCSCAAVVVKRPCTQRGAHLRGDGPPDAPPYALTPFLLSESRVISERETIDAQLPLSGEHAECQI